MQTKHLKKNNRILQEPFFLFFLFKPCLEKLSSLKIHEEQKLLLFNLFYVEKKLLQMLTLACDSFNILNLNYVSHLLFVSSSFSLIINL